MRVMALDFLVEVGEGLPEGLDAGGGGRDGSGEGGRRG